MDTRFDDQFFYYADKYDIDFSLVKGISMVESSLDPFAIRFEPKYEYIMPLKEIQRLARLCGISVDTETMLQRCSFGLMQIMGANIRSYGFIENLTSLFDDHSLSIQFGCRMISGLFKRYKSIDDVISAYNAGEPKRKVSTKYINQEYVDNVKAKIKLIETV